MKNLLFLSTIILVAALANGQGQTAFNKIRIHSVTNAGLLNGSKGASIGLQTILGADLKGSFLGAGIGLDYYRFRSLPVFAHLSQEFGKDARNFFIYGDLGHHYDWVTKKNKQEANIELISDFRGGIFYEAGLGYKIAFNKRDALLLSTGYSFKKMTRQAEVFSCAFLGPCLTSTEIYHYTMPRLALKAGWSF